MRQIAALLFAGPLLFAACTSGPPADQAADTVYRNGRIYTVNEAQPWAEAVAIKDGKFLVVGSNADLEAVTGDDTEIVDLEGQFVMPGLVDTHTHPLASAIQALDQLVLESPKNLEDIQQQVLAYAKANPDKEWIEGLAWPKGMFKGENAMREWLDEVVSDRPVSLMDQGGHARWVNTKALEVTGVMDPDFEVPKYGVVERDQNGVPSGTVRETMTGHLATFAPASGPDVYAEAVVYVQELFNRNGVTAHRTAQGNEHGLRALDYAAKNGDLSLHWAVSLDVNLGESPFPYEERMRQIDNRSQFASDYVSVDLAKIFVDSDLNGFGINLKEPFEGTTDEYGSTTIEPEELNRLVAMLDGKGISIQFHAIGDQTIEYVVDALQAAADANGGKLNTRHYPDHMGFITPEQIDRLVELNGVIGFAPYFSFTFPGIHESYLQFVGKDRLARMQPLRTALDAGAILGTGTDYSSLPQDPWPLLEGMVHRRNPWVPEGESEVNGPDEVITLEEAIHIYTLGGAHAILAEDRIGSIEEGKYADFIVLDRNLLEIPVDEIDETDVLRTVFSGQTVYEKESDEFNVETIEITNASLQNAVDAADLQMLVADELSFGTHSCSGFKLEFSPGAGSAPSEVNLAFATLADQGHRYARPARTVYWKNDNSTYWIQWTVKDDRTVLWAYDPDARTVVEILQVKDR